MDFSSILRTSFTKSDLDSCYDFVVKLSAHEPPIQRAIAQMNIEKIPGPYRFKRIAKAILDCMGEEKPYHIKPNTQTIQCKILETIVLQLCLSKPIYAARSITEAQFAEKYGISDCFEETLFRNALVVASFLIPPKNNKERIIDLVTRVVHGIDKDGEAIKFVNGSGRTPQTSVLYEIFETENGLQVERRNFSPCNEDVTRVQKRKISACNEDATSVQKSNEDATESDQKRGKGRPSGSKNLYNPANEFKAP
jgi:hypothetical protein